MKFVKLTTYHCYATTGKEKSIYINVDNINTMQIHLGKGGERSTDIVMNNGQRMSVKETPEDIKEKVDEKTYEDIL